MIIFIILLLGVLVAVGYLYVTNRKLKNELSQMKQDQVLTTPVTEPSRAPLPSEEISVENGSVIRTNSSGEKALLIDKTLYENVGIIGFARVIVSPDEKKMCFEAWPPAPTPGLYLADITGQNVVYVADNGKDCVWSNDSTKIAYTKQAVKTSQVDLFYYDLTSTEEINLTKDAAGPGMLRVYENPTWSVDNQTITATYTETDPTKAVADTTGVSEITVLTGKVSDQNNITLSATPSPSPKPSAPPVQI